MLFQLIERPDPRSRQWIINNSDRLSKDELQDAIKQLEGDIAKLRKQIENIPDRT
jgi:hypothetical protein